MRAKGPKGPKAARGPKRSKAATGPKKPKGGPGAPVGLAASTAAKGPKISTRRAAYSGRGATAATD
jgi:hypothetical protein